MRMKITPRMREFLMWVKQGEPHETFRGSDLHIFHRAERLGLLETTSFYKNDVLLSKFSLTAAGRAALGDDTQAGGRDDN